MTWPITRTLTHYSTLNGGSIGDIIKSAAITFATAEAFAQIGGHYGDGHPFLSPVHLQKIVAHGIVGGLSSVAQGGDFFSGFLSAGVTQAGRVSGLIFDTGG